MPKHQSPSWSAPSWLGLPALADLLSGAGLDAQLRLGVAATGTAVRLITASGEVLLQAGEARPCTLCPPLPGGVAALPGTHELEACSHDVYTRQAPVVADGSRVASLVFGPFRATVTPDGAPPSALERVAAVATLVASALSTELTQAALRARVGPTGADRDAERLRLALEATSDAIWDWDLETDRTYFSPRWFAMLGYPLGAFEPSFESWARMTVPEDVERTRAIVQRAIAEGTGYEAEFRMYHADGTLRWILGRGRVTGRDENGRPNRMSGTNTDITQRKQAHHDQAALEARLRAAEKLAAMGRLAGGIAHDFNNQLTVVIGSATLLQNHLREPHEIKILDNLVQAATRSADLTRKMLAFARMDRENRAQVDLHAVLADIGAHVPTGTAVTVRQQLAASPCVVPGETAAISSALTGLSRNARDAMPEGGTLTLETRSIWIDAESAAAIRSDFAPGPYVEISISDTGVGISQEDLGQLFEPFFSTKTGGLGRGMGLAEAYGTVRRHGGAIDVDTQLGIGSTFRVCLPYEGLERDADDARALLPTDPRVRDLPPQRVLVVDDEPLVRQALLALIGAFGYEVECCADGPTAIARVERLPDIGLVILDLVLPGMTGPAIFRAMRALRPNLQLLVSSGYVDSDEGRALVAEGAAGILAKPFRAQELARTLAQLLGAPRA